MNLILLNIKLNESCSRFMLMHIYFSTLFYNYSALNEKHDWKKPVQDASFKVRRLVLQSHDLSYLDLT